MVQQHTYHKEIFEGSVSECLAFLAGGDVAEQLYVDDGKDHEEDAREQNDDQQLRSVSHYLEEELLDGVVGSQQPGKTSRLQMWEKGKSTHSYSQ